MSSCIAYGAEIRWTFFCNARAVWHRSCGGWRTAQRSVPSNAVRRVRTARNRGAPPMPGSIGIGLQFLRNSSHCGRLLLIDMKIYLGDRLLWRVFTYDLYRKIVLRFLSKVFTYDQGTKPAVLRWSQKAPFFLTRKNVIFWTRKNSVFSHSPTEVVDNPKSTVKKYDHKEEK